MQEDKPRTRAPGGGRNPIYDQPMKSCNTPMTEEHRAKLKRLGGAAWIRAKIEAEPEPLPSSKKSHARSM